jgi:hypothetical protein
MPGSRIVKPSAAASIGLEAVVTSSSKRQFTWRDFWNARSPRQVIEPIEGIMIVAAHPAWLVPAIVALAIVFYVALGWVILKGYRWLKRVTEAAQWRAFEGLKIHDSPAPGLVLVVFHTYYGFIAFGIQTEHRFWAPPDDAREALWRLHRFNLTWGMFAYGALVIPLLSFGNYLAQRRSIRRQETAQLY